MNKNKIFLILKRLVVAFVDIGIVAMASLMMMVFIAEPLAEVCVNISEVRKEYEQKCLDYEIHFYDEEKKQYLVNENATEEQKLAFESDERVIELTKIQNGTTFVELYGSVSLASVVLYVLIPLFDKRGATLAKKYMNLKVVDLKGNNVSKKMIVIRGTSYFLINVIGGIISQGIFIGISLLVSILNSEGRSIHDLISKTKVIALNSKYDIVKEEDDEYYKMIAKENARDLRVKGENYYDK